MRPEVRLRRRDRHCRMRASTRGSAFVRSLMAPVTVLGGSIMQREGYKPWGKRLVLLVELQNKVAPGLSSCWAYRPPWWPVGVPRLSPWVRWQAAIRKNFAGCATGMKNEIVQERSHRGGCCHLNNRFEVLGHPPGGLTSFHFYVAHSSGMFDVRLRYEWIGGRNLAHSELKIKT